MNPRARDLEGDRALAPGKRDPASAQREGSASPSGGQGGGRRGRSACPPRARSCGSAAETREAGPGTRSGQGWGARGTHQLQCAEADERAAPGAAAHGAGGVRAARAAGDPRLPAPPPPGSGAAPARHSPARPAPAPARLPAAAARRGRVCTRAPPLLVSRAGRGQYGAHDPRVWRGSLPPAVRVRFLGRGSRAGGAGGGRQATDGEWVEVCLGEGSMEAVGV